jgi:ferredoxin
MMQPPGYKTRRTGWLILPSTRRFFEAASAARLSWSSRLHGYFYARWTYLYIGIGMGEHPIARLIGPLTRALGSRTRPADPDRPTTADGYHGKVLPLEAARQLIRVQESISLGDLEHVIPYRLARELVLEDPDHIVALECPCRSARATPCMPLDVCLVVGEPFASFTAEHHPGRARWITSGEAEGILEREHARGHVQHAFFKDAMLGRFYAICNCCPCCCGAMQAHRQGTPMLAASGYRALVDPAGCSGCEACLDVCPFDAIRMQDSVPFPEPVKCMGCGVCVSACTAGALSLVRDPQQGIPLELDRLMQAAAGRG